MNGKANTTADRVRRDFIALARVVAAEDPHMSATALLDRLEELIEGVVAGRPEATCRYCDRPIVMTSDERWVHQDPDASVGCRAASFNWGRDGWDPALEGKQWKATPLRGWAQ